MAITKMGMLVVVVGLLAMVQQSVQMSSSSMLKETENDLSSSPWAIVFSRRTSERVLLESGDFEHNSTKIIAGRVFRTGFLIGSPVVLVNTGKYSANVASALQIALSTYRIRGVLYFGNAGDLSLRTVPIGSVVIPSEVSFTGIWDWLDLYEDEEGELVFGSFNEDGNVQNRLGSIKFKNVALYTGKNEVSYPRYLVTPRAWIRKAESIKALLPNITIIVGQSASSSDIKVKNAAYANFLGNKLGTKGGYDVVDEESATVALVSKSNGKPYIVFHGVSNSARFPRRSPDDPTAKVTAAKNAYTVLKTFLKQLPQPLPLGYITTYV